MIKKLLPFVFLCMAFSLIAQDAPFITTWRTDSSGVSSDTQIIIPTLSGYSYDYNVYWEEVDNADNNGTLTGLTGNDTINFPSAGTYRIEITGTFPAINFDGSSNTKDNKKILSVDQWGDIQWQTMAYAFSNCSNLTSAATDAPDLSNITNLNGMFFSASSFNGDLSSWDVSSVTNMRSMFFNASSFNGDLSNWDVSSVTSMYGMFSGASSFNGDISNWDVSSVTDMYVMFNDASSFNGDLSNWDISNVTNMSYMFRSASSFNGDLSNWDVSSVTSIYGMFAGASSFNGDLSNWDVSNVTSMASMFSNASSFNGDLSNWDVSSVTDMSYMFSGASSFNGDLSNWDVSNVTSMASMFSNASSFNGDLSNWDVSSVNNMSHMFRGGYSFNGDISNWDVSSVTDMAYMFRDASSFNGDLSSWDVSSVTDIHQMFFNAYSFNGDLSNWDISSVTNMAYMFSSSQISSSNYDKILSAWANLDSLQSDITLGADGLEYCLSSDSRQQLIDNYNWTITGDIQNCDLDDLSERSEAIAFTIGDQAYMGLGKNDSLYFSDWFVLDVANDTSYFLADFPGAARSSAVSFVIDSLAYVGLGEDEEGNYLVDFYSYDPSTDSWAQLADFGGGARSNAVAFAIGDYGYVGTGINDTDEQSDFWKYDPSTDTWTELEDSGIDKRQAAFAFVIDDKAYVGGGYYDDGTEEQLNDLQEFDPVTGTWTEKIDADNVNLNTNNAIAFSLYGNGYIAYGSNDQLVRYNPKSNEVASLGDYFELGTNLNNPVGYTIDDVAYVGFGSYTENSSVVYSIEFYTFHPVNELPTAISLSDSIIRENDTIGTFIGVFSSTDADETGEASYALASGDGTNDAGNEAFYISNDSLFAALSFDYETQNEYAIYVEVTDSRGGTYAESIVISIENIVEPSEILNRSEAVGLSISNTSYVGLGTNGEVFYSDWFVQDVANDTSYFLADFPGAARASAVSFVIDSLAYVGLGEDEEGNYLADFYSYDPSTDTWAQLADFGGGARSNAVAFTIGDYGYVGTGINDTDEQSDFWKYDPSTDTWTELEDTGIDKRQAAFAFVIDDKAYVGGGYYFDSFQNQLSDIQEFDPETVSWTEKIFADGINLSTNNAIAFSLYGYGYIAYGSKSKLIKYNPETNEVESLGDYFELGTNLNDPIAYTLDDSAYVGLGSYTESFSTVYSNEFYSYFEANELPTDISLSESSLNENLDSAVFVATISSVDADETGEASYALASGDGSNDTGNDAFYLSNDSLYTAMSFDYESQNEYAIYVEVTDSRGGAYSEAFTISITNVNEAPTEISLSSLSVDESNTETVAVGTFTTSDEDQDDSHTYSIVSGDGSNDADNDQFETDGEELFIINPDFEIQSAYVVNIQSSDLAGLSTTQSFTIAVNDLNEAPSEITFTAEDVFEEDVIGTLAGTFETIDEDADQTFTYSLEVASDTFEIVNDSLFTISEFDFLADQTYTVSVSSTDQGGLSFTKTFEVLVIDVEEPEVLGTSHDKLLIYPNPFGEQFYLQNAADKHLEMYSLSGQKVLDQKLTKDQESIDVAHLPAGIYVLKVYSGNISKELKVIKE